MPIPSTANSHVDIEQRPDSATSEVTIVPEIESAVESQDTQVIKDLADTDINVADISSANQTNNSSDQNLTESYRSNQAKIKMKEHTNNGTDPDSANGNTTDNSSNETDTSKEDINKNEKDFVVSDKDEKQNNPPVFIPKYKYSDDQWSPLNTSGKKYYELSLLKQLKDNPHSKDKPDIPKLEQCKIMRSTPIMDSLPFMNLPSRPNSDALFPNFVKSVGDIPKDIFRDSRDAKKDFRNLTPNHAKGNFKYMGRHSTGGGGMMKPVPIHVSLTGDVKLNQSENAWKPTRFRKDQSSEDDFKTQEVYKKFRGILNKLTPQKFETLVEKVKLLEINTQKCLEGVIDLVFEKAIEEPNFSKAYATLCLKLSALKVPADNPTNKSNTQEHANFRILIINKCQNQFVAKKLDEQVQKLEKEYAECKDPIRKKELNLMLQEENRRVRMRSVGNVRFIGELYKLKMLTARIMVFCMNYLIDPLEEEKLECLCKLLTTIGQLVESEVKDNLDVIFKRIQDIVDKKTNQSKGLSSRVRFMLQDVIELRNRRWVTKTVVDLQPKMMTQIQKEAEQQHRQTELLNASPTAGAGGYRRERERDDRGKRADGRRGQLQYMDNGTNYKNTKISYSIDSSKLKAAGNKDLHNIKLAPQMARWGSGSGAAPSRPPSAPSHASPAPHSAPHSAAPALAVANKYSMLDYVQDAPVISHKDVSPSHNEKSLVPDTPVITKEDDSVAIKDDVAEPLSEPEPNVEAATIELEAQEPLTDQQRSLVRALIEQNILSPDDKEMVFQFKKNFKPQHEASVVSEIFNVVIEKPAKVIPTVSNSILHLVTSKTIAPANFVSGLGELLEIAPDLYIDVPMLYHYLSQIIVPHIHKEHITFAQILSISDSIIVAKQSHLFLKSLINELKSLSSPEFVKERWHESACQMKQWMPEEQAKQFITDNKLEFLEEDASDSDVTEKAVSSS